jgi:hypothetical protein
MKIHHTAFASAGTRRNYRALWPRRGMDRQQVIALFFAFLMVSSMVAWGISFL